ncbi:AraC family transcriptional regulator [Actinoplanes sp. OR16]|uniref:AraC family transcriptional regulator n=1 Tax=Actinoplanes sp. OR16 TaxID=946334 RepID=UPI000F700D13|nr:AraC family transcriptional regulator [Actinoplanes sp. OR16]BBH71609.1 AraC family transcriptional regulator [Actinoplanes sp. OR16]
MIDPIGAALHLLRLTGTLYCNAELTAPWGVAVPELPGELAIVIVTAGGCHLEIDGEDDRHLTAGSLTLLPHGTPHRFRSEPGVPVEPLFELPVEPISDRYELLRHGGGGERTQVTYGVLRFDHAIGDRLVAQLPPVLHLAAWAEADADWRDSTLRLIAREAQTLRPGGETVLTRLADILVVQAIRAWLATAPEARQGWLAALRDDQIGFALAAVHRRPGADWTVASLAKEAGMSRSAFAARFTDLVGEPAMHYVAQWRMRLAHSHLRESAEPLSAVAHRFGYRSEAAFSRAFRRTFGVPPGAVRDDVNQFRSSLALN